MVIVSDLKLTCRVAGATGQPRRDDVGSGSYPLDVALDRSLSGRGRSHSAPACRGGAPFIVSMFTAVLTSFGLVLGAGFVLGSVRTRWLAPLVRERHAEWLETPVMLIVIWMGARFIVGRLNRWAVVRRLGTGTLALLLLLLAEWGGPVRASAIDRRVHRQPGSRTRSRASPRVGAVRGGPQPGRR
jgi:hypothetical protein